MFTFGGFDAMAVPGLYAVLSAWPGMPEVQLHTVASPGRDGVFFADAALSSGEWTFDLTAVASSPEAVLAITDQVAHALNPRQGQQALRVDVAPGWTWSAVVSSLSSWSRVFWVPGSECRLSATVTLATPDSYGYATPDEEWSWGQGASNLAGGVTLTREKGNADSFPTIEIGGVLSAAQSVTLSLDGQPVTVTGPLATGQVMRLDYADMDFGVWSAAGVKVRSLVPSMSSFTRLTLPVGESTFAASSGGTLSSVKVQANSRRV